MPETAVVLIHRIVISAPVARSVAIAALSATTMLASPLTAARDTTDTAVTIVLAQTSPQLAAAEATDTFVETFDQRITKLCERMVSAEEYCQPR